MIYKPPAAFVSSVNLISVPRPAMLVAIVTELACPALRTMSASLSCCLAFSTSCLTPNSFKNLEISSDSSIVIVPTSTGCLRSEQSFISSATALYLPSLVP